MRHIIGSIIAVDTMPLPRLIVVDFVKSGISLYYILIVTSWFNVNLNHGRKILENIIL